MFDTLPNEPLGPDDIRPMAAAYELVLHKLGLIARTDPITLIIAKKIIEIVQSGERNPARISRRALSELGIETPSIKVRSRLKKSAA